MNSVAQVLIENEVIRTNFTDPFTFSSGIKSPIYCDCRELIAIPQARKTVTAAWIDYLRENEIEFDVVAGTATAGIPWAAFLAAEMDKPMLYVRSKPKGYGAGKMVGGKQMMDQRILVAEDLFSTGGSSIKSAEALRTELNATVTDILGIFSWDTPLIGKNTESSKLKAHAMASFGDVIGVLYEMKKINAAEKASLERFKADPQNWYRAE